MFIDRLPGVLAFVPLAVFSLSPVPLLAAMPLEQALQIKPVISNLLPNDTRLEEVSDALGLTRDERDNLDALVLAEKEEVARLLQQSNLIVRDDRLSLDQKRAAIEAMDYNGQIARLARSSSQELQNLLGPGQWEAFLQWGQRAWEEDAEKSGPVSIEEQAGVTSVQYKVYATQYDAYTTYEVAVPDKYVKFAAQGTSYATGYPPDLNYSVTLDRSSYHYTVRVYEVGPWNIDDNYWDAANDPNRPRRMFTDLAQGMPESQAAYTSGYNGGKDQYGRTVANQAGVDLSPAVASNIGLAYLQNDWVTVTYLWETGSSSGGGSTTGNLVGYIRENDIYSGKGISGATVKLNTGKSVTADSNGYYKFTGIAAGSYTVTASANCYASNSTSKTVTAGIDNWASIALTADGSCGVGTISGYVRDSATQDPVVGATLTLNTGVSTTSNSSGYYTFKSVVPGTYTVNVTANCFIATSTSVTAVADQTTYKDITMNSTTCGGGSDGGGDGGSSCGARVMLPGDARGPGRSSTGILAAFGTALWMIATQRRRR